MTTKRPRYLFAVCMKGSGKFCRRFGFRIGDKPITTIAVYRTRKEAAEDCPVYGEVVMFKEVKK